MIIIILQLKNKSLIEQNKMKFSIWQNFFFGEKKSKKNKKIVLKKNLF